MSKRPSDPRVQDGQGDGAYDVEDHCRETDAGRIIEQQEADDAYEVG